MPRLLDAPRLPGWERAFVDAMSENDAIPFGYGVDQVDCLRRVARVCIALTGIDPMKGHRRYATEKGALKQLSKAGYADIGQALSGVFPVIPNVLARRGDCGIFEQVIEGQTRLAAYVVIQNHMASAKGANGNSFVPVGALKTVFAVGL